MLGDLFLGSPFLFPDPFTRVNGNNYCSKVFNILSFNPDRINSSVEISSSIITLAVDGLFDEKTSG